MNKELEGRPTDADELVGMMADWRNLSASLFFRRYPQFYVDRAAEEAAGWKGYEATLLAFVGYASAIDAEKAALSASPPKDL